MKLLFICQEGIHRSPTAVQVAKDMGHEARASALRSDDKMGEDLKWADRVFVMERSMREFLVKNFRHIAKKRRIIVLNIEDKYHKGDDKLISILDLKIRQSIENEPRKLLFLCDLNKQRGPTCAALMKTYGYDARSTALYELKGGKYPVRNGLLPLLEWADVVFVMTDEEKRDLLEKYPKRSPQRAKELYVLDLSDNLHKNDMALICAVCQRLEDRGFPLEECRG